jgi:hypothetical protein
MFYVGKVCVRHPELKGQRRTKSRACHQCIVERMRVARKELRRRRREEKAAGAINTSG